MTKTILILKRRE